MSTTVSANRRGLPHGLLPALLINAVWINASEIFRYFTFVMPMMRKALPGVPNVAPMNPGVFAIWGVWDTLLLFVVTGFSWMFLDRFGLTWKKALLAGSLLWLSIFVILWAALFNMSLADVKIVSVALPLAWAELVVASLITLRAMKTVQR